LRVLEGVDFGGGGGGFEFFDFELFLTLFLGLPLFVPLVGLAVFFLLLDDLLELFLAFWSSSCASWFLRFEI
jgi:hypothetical protein